MSLALLFPHAGYIGTTPTSDFDGWNGEMFHVLKGVRDTLRTFFVAQTNLAQTTARIANYIDIQPDGNPPPTMGSWYVAVDEAQIVTTQQHATEQSEYQVTVTLTREAKGEANDRLKYIYQSTSGDGLRSNPGLDQLEQYVKNCINANQSVRLAANNSISQPTGYDQFFRTPLYYTGRSSTRFESGDWAGLQPEAKSFLVRQLTFGGMKAFTCNTLARLGPFSLTATASAGTVTLTWEDSSLTETAYKVYRSADNGMNYTNIGTTSSNTGTYADSGVSGTYSYYVSMVQADGIEVASPVVKVTA